MQRIHLLIGFLLGVDPEGQVYIPMAPDLAPAHHYVAGHPVTAEGH